MHKSQVNRAMIQRRVSRNPESSAGARPCTNVAARVDSIIPLSHVHNRKAVRMTAAQRDSTGKRSAWSASPYFFTDPAWSYTVSEQTSVVTA